MADPQISFEDETPETEKPNAAEASKQDLADMASRYGLDTARSAYDQLAKSSEQARESLRKARERILARQYDRSHALLALAAGLGAPTRTGAFGESMSNVAQALQGPLQAKMQFETDRDRDLLGVDSGLLDIDRKMADSALRLAELRIKGTTGSDLPMSWKEYQLFKTLSPKEQQVFLEVKRAQQLRLADVDQVPTVVDLTRRNPDVPLSTVQSEADAARRIEEARKEGMDTGAARAAAKATLNTVLDRTGIAQNLITSLIDHPAREWMTGATSFLPLEWARGTQFKDFEVKLKQLTSTAFLEAYNMLRGGGHITDLEGKTATEAMARLDRAQSEPAFVEALEELFGVLEGGKKRALAAAGATPSATAPDSESPQAESPAASQAQGPKVIKFKALPKRGEQ